jgi:hypothetical protein
MNLPDDLRRQVLRDTARRSRPSFLAFRLAVLAHFQLSAMTNTGTTAATNQAQLGILLASMPLQMIPVAVR